MCTVRLYSIRHLITINSLNVQYLRIIVQNIKWITNINRMQKALLSINWHLLHGPDYKAT